MDRGTKGRLFTGARARFSINGIRVGYARNVTINEEVQLDPVEVLDSIEVLEHTPVAYRCRMTASMFRIVGETLKKAGWFAASGQNNEEHLQNILTTAEQNLTATIEDTKTGKILATVQQIQITSKNWTVDARGITGEDAEFVAIRVKDESEI